MTPAQRLINNQGILFKIERNGSVISELKGTQNYEPSTSKRFVGFMPGSDVQPGDRLINPANERLFVYDTLTDFLNNKMNQLKAYYQTVAEYNSKTNADAKYMFNIGSANNSVIGTQNTVTMNPNSSLQQIRERINSSNSETSDELQQIIPLLEMIINNQVPVQKGLLLKLADAVQKNSWIAGPMASIILDWLLAQFH